MEMFKIGTGQATGLGDVLLLTAICKYMPNCIVELHPKVERFSRFFQGQCKEIIIKENPVDLSNIGTDHYALCKMRGIGLNGKCHLPHIVLTEKDIQRGKELIADYPNPIAFVPNCSKSWAHMREMPKEKWHPILKKLQKDHTILQFGFESNFTDFDNTVKIKNCSIEDLVCYFSVIKKYIGVDTGDRHLMLACGGTEEVFCPPSNLHYDHHRWHYNSSRSTYHIF
jgi:hypothetical protein